jgi:hypothetical protein
MRNLDTPVKFQRVNSLRADDVRRRVSECRERLRKGRGERRISVCATPGIGQPFGEETQTLPATAMCGEVAESG